MNEKSDNLRNLVLSLPRKDRDACTPERLKEFSEAIKSFLNADRFPSNFAALNSMYGCISGVATQTAHLVQMYRNAGGTDPSQFLTNKTLAAAGRGR